MTSETTTTAAVITAIIAGAFTLTKKLMPGKEYVTRAEFHQALDAINEKITAGFTAINQRFEQIDHQFQRINEKFDEMNLRLTYLEAAVARLDERTKN